LARPVGWFVGSLVLAATTYASSGAAASGPALPGVVSGSRLRAKIRDGGGGAVRFAGWFDTELGVPCSFVLARDGQLRCLPGPLAVHSDPTCTMPVWGRTRDFATPPPYVIALFPLPGVGGAVYPLGAPYTGAARNTSGSRCVDGYAPSGSYYGTGAEIPSERFVSATVRKAPVEYGASVSTSTASDGSSRIRLDLGPRFVSATGLDDVAPDTAYRGSGRLRVLSYVDGESQVIEATMLDDFFDAEAKTPCHAEPFADGLRCVPRNLPRSTPDGPYLDAGCTTPLSEYIPLELDGRALSLPAPGASLDSDGAVATAHALGGVVTPDTVYFGRAACHPRNPLPGFVYRRLGPPIGDSQWAPVTTRME
jgi:hypothetical protein